MELQQRLIWLIMVGVCMLSGCAGDEQSEQEGETTSTLADGLTLIFPPEESVVILDSSEPKLLEIIVSAESNISNLSIAGERFVRDEANAQLWRGSVMFQAGENLLKARVNGEAEQALGSVYGGQGLGGEDNFGLTTKDIRLLAEENRVIYSRVDGLYQYDLMSRGVTKLASFNCAACDLAIDNHKIAYVLNEGDVEHSLLRYDLQSGVSQVLNIAFESGESFSYVETMEFIRDELYVTTFNAKLEEETVFIINPTSGSARSAAGNVHYKSINSDIVYDEARNMGFIVYPRSEEMQLWRFNEAGEMESMALIGMSSYIERGGNADNSQIIIDYETQTLYITSRHNASLSSHDISAFLNHLEMVNFASGELQYHYLLSEPIMLSLGFDFDEGPYQTALAVDRHDMVPAPALDLKKGIGYMVIRGRLNAINLKTGERTILAQ